MENSDITVPPLNQLLGILPFLYSQNCYKCAYSYSYGSGFLCQQTQALNNAQCQSYMRDLQLQQCCCNPVNMAMIPRVSVPSQASCNEKEDFVYRLDKVLFPDDPIRDYIKEEIRKIQEKYKSRIEAINSVL